MFRAAHPPKDDLKTKRICLSPLLLKTRFRLKFISILSGDPLDTPLCALVNLSMKCQPPAGKFTIKERTARAPFCSTILFFGANTQNSKRWAWRPFRSSRTGHFARRSMAYCRKPGSFAHSTHCGFRSTQRKSRSQHRKTLAQFTRWDCSSSGECCPSWSIGS